MYWMVEVSKAKQASTHQMLLIRNQKNYNHNVGVVSQCTVGSSWLL